MIKSSLISFVILLFEAVAMPVFAQSIVGDANGDGKVDGIDYIVWLSHYNQNVTGPSNGDFDTNGKVDGVDYTLWLINYGRVATPTSTNTPTIKPTYTNTPTPTHLPGDGKHVYEGQSLQTAINSLKSGEILYVHEGEYRENLRVNETNIRITAWPGDRVVVKGISSFTLTNSVIDGINFTWPDNGTNSQHMVRFVDGTGWTFQNAEVWGAHSYAAILVTGDTNGGWTMRNLYVHDTYKSNGLNQDHLIYVSSCSSGVIERSLLVNSPNGRGIKLGTAGGGSGPKNVTIRYNTFYDNLGPSNIQLSDGAAGNQMYRNIFQKSNSYNVRAQSGMGSGNRAYDNFGWDSDGVVDPDISQSGNIFEDPQFTSVTNRDFHPKNPKAQAYGKYAP